MASVPTPTPTAAATRRCENCGAPLLGEHCYACGQPTRGLVRHFSSILGDFVDSVLNFDTRTVRTLGPLLLRPGKLSLEYFYGHRVRYVSPVRLFFFLCVLAFFVLRLTVELDFSGAVQQSAIARADSVAQVETLRDQAVAELRQARAEIPDTPGARVGMDIAIAGVQNEAAARIAWLRQRDDARARGETVPRYEGRPLPENTEGHVRVRTTDMQFNDQPWDPVTNPVTLDGLPAGGNALLNRLIGRAQANVERIRESPRLLVEAFLSALPAMLFLLLPVFALLLKIAYLFKRRLYMEHLIVALHSHAFLCAALLLLVTLSELGDALAPGAGESLMRWGEAAVAMWMPLYLFIMQKRVYGQGWILSGLKFLVLGTCYLLLLVLGALFNLAFNLVAM